MGGGGSSRLKIESAGRKQVKRTPLDYNPVITNKRLVLFHCSINIHMKLNISVLMY